MKMEQNKKQIEKKYVDDLISKQGTKTEFDTHFKKAISFYKNLNKI